MRNILAYGLGVLLALILFVPVLIVSGLFKYDKLIYTLGRLVIRTVLNTAGVKIKVRGLAAIDFSVPMVVICNHLSNLDGPLLVNVLPCNPRVLIKAETRKVPLIGWVMKMADFVFVERKKPLRWQEALTEAVEKIKEKKYSFLVFPEGTRSKNGIVQDFKKGSFLIAIKAGVPVLPVKISGTNQLLPPGEMLISRGLVKIDFFPPIEVANVAENQLEELIQNIQQKIFRDEEHENH